MEKPDDFKVNDDNWHTVSKLGYRHVVPYLEFLYEYIHRLEDKIQYNKGSIVKINKYLEDHADSIKLLRKAVGKHKIDNTD